MKERLVHRVALRASMSASFSDEQFRVACHRDDGSRS